MPLDFALIEWLASRAVTNKIVHKVEIQKRVSLVDSKYLMSIWAINNS